MHKFLAGIGVLAFFVTGDVVLGATYYVSKSGSDGNSCSQAQSQSAAMSSINRGVSCLRAGDTLLVRGGTYAEGLDSPTMGSGTDWNSPVRVAAYPGETVWMKPPAGPAAVIYLTSQRYVEFDGINLDASNATSARHMGGLWINWETDTVTAHHIRFQNADITGNRIGGDLQTSYQGINIAVPSGGGVGFNELLNVRIYGTGGPNANYGMYIHGSNNVMDGCDIYDVGYMGIQIYNDGGATPTGNIIRNNRIHDITQGMDARRMGILVAGNNTLVYNNIIYNINANGSYSQGSTAAISAFAGTGNKIFNNTIVNNRSTAIDLGSVSNTEVRNNITYGNAFEGILSSGGTGTTLSTNLFGIDAQFVNTGAGDFHLKSGSPAIDAGTNVAAVSTDITNTPRPQGKSYDIGAYEFSTSATQTQPPAAPTGVRIVSN
jgi:hypothetical protein